MYTQILVLGSCGSKHQKAMGGAVVRYSSEDSWIGLSSESQYNVVAVLHVGLVWIQEGCIEQRQRCRWRCVGLSLKRRGDHLHCCGPVRDGTENPIYKVRNLVDRSRGRVWCDVC